MAGPLKNQHCIKSITSASASSPYAAQDKKYIPSFGKFSFVYNPQIQVKPRVLVDGEEYERGPPPIYTPMSEQLIIQDSKALNIALPDEIGDSSKPNVSKSKKRKRNTHE
jgi:hypothetical protein